MDFPNYLQTRTLYGLNPDIMSTLRLKVEVKGVSFLGELMLPTLLVLLFPLLSETFFYCCPPLVTIIICTFGYLCNTSWSNWTLKILVAPFLFHHPLSGLHLCIRELCSPHQTRPFLHREHNVGGESCNCL